MLEPPRGAFDYLLGPQIPPTPADPPPRRDETPRRLHIHIQLVIPGPTPVPMPLISLTPEPRRRHKAAPLLGWIILALVLIGLLARCGAAQAQDRQTDPRDWRATSYPPDSATGTVRTDWYGPHGESRHCTTYRPDATGTVRTDCY
jgi:hypothetical protein